MGTPVGAPLEFPASPATPAAPAADNVLLFGRKVAGRMLPAFVGPAGIDSSLQPILGRNRVMMWTGHAGQTTVGTFGINAVTAIGTATAAGLATTNVYTWVHGVEYLVTAASATAIAGVRYGQAVCGRGNAAGRGGFFLIFRWGPATGVATATHRAFCGLNVVGTPTDVEPSSRVNILGMGWDAADSNIQFMHNDGSGTATKIDLGATFPVPTSDRSKIYEIAMFCPPNGSTVSYQVTDIGTEDTTSGSVTTDMPSATALLAPLLACSVGGTSSVVGSKICSMYLETDI
jgi:hypothetical protein